MSKLSNLSLSDLYGLKNSLVEKRKYDIELLIANGKHEKAIEKGCEDNATNNTLRAINEEIERRETDIINEITEDPEERRKREYKINQDFIKNLPGPLHIKNPK